MKNEESFPDQFKASHQIETEEPYTVSHVINVYLSQP